MGCLNSPLFSLLILAAAAGEAWANDDESKRLTWKPFSWSSRMKSNNEVLWHLKVRELNLRHWFTVVYCVAHLNFCRHTKKTKPGKVRYCWWCNNQNHIAQSDAEHPRWHLPALGKKAGGGFGCSSTCSVCPDTILPVFYSPVDLASSISLSSSDTLWRCLLLCNSSKEDVPCLRANFYSLLTISGNMLGRWWCFQGRERHISVLHTCQEGLGRWARAGYRKHIVTATCYSA